jgi:hypothetical protein
MTTGDWISIAASVAALVVSTYLGWRWEAIAYWIKRRRQIEAIRREHPAPGEQPVRALYSRQYLGPVWMAVLLDGSTVIARRFGLSRASAVRRGTDANLKTGASTLRYANYREGTDV